MKSNNISKFIVRLIISSIAFSAKDNQIHSMEISCNENAEDTFVSLFDEYYKKYEAKYGGQINILDNFIEEKENELDKSSNSLGYSSISSYSNKSAKESVKEIENLLTTPITNKTEKRKNDEKIYCIDDHDIEINTSSWDKYTNGMIENYKDEFNYGKDDNLVTEMEEYLAKNKEKHENSYIKNTEIAKNKIDDMIDELHVNDENLVDLLNVVNVAIDGLCINNIQNLNYKGFYNDLQNTVTSEDPKDQTSNNLKYICKPAYYLTKTRYQEIEPYVKKFLAELVENIDIESYRWKIREQLGNRLKTLINKKKEINPFWWEMKFHGKEVNQPALLYSAIKTIIEKKTSNDQTAAPLMKWLEEQIEELIKKKLTNGKNFWDLRVAPKKETETKQKVKFVVKKLTNEKIFLPMGKSQKNVYKFVIPLNLNEFKLNDSVTQNEAIFMYGSFSLPSDLDEAYIYGKMEIYYVNPEKNLLLARIHAKGKPPKEITGRIHRA